MKYILTILTLTILLLSVCFNVFMVSNYQANCSNIDSRWKADILYKLGHKGLDSDSDGIPCENLPYNQD